ncbi:hypothetical protein BJX66DRAFT_119152 [Aspergillus keveii]|uniref:Uncharacterized protein n=1 Tax=Aspergillus keveii TaxID=714993 RepID=A0ABR4FK86_9EURO
MSLNPCYSLLSVNLCGSTWILHGGACVVDASSLPGVRTQPISLYDMCTDLVINPYARILLDPALFDIDLDMALEMRALTDELWKLLSQS